MLRDPAALGVAVRAPLERRDYPDAAEEVAGEIASPPPAARVVRVIERATGTRPRPFATGSRPVAVPLT